MITKEEMIILNGSPCMGKHSSTMTCCECESYWKLYGKMMGWIS